MSSAMTITMSSAHSLTFPSLHLRHNSFSNPSVASPTSQLILQPFFRFSYVTGSSLTSPGEPPMIFDVKYSKFICRRFRIYIIILSMIITINYFDHNFFLLKNRAGRNDDCYVGYASPCFEYYCILYNY